MYNMFEWAFWSLILHMLESHDLRRFERMFQENRNWLLDHLNRFIMLDKYTDHYNFPFWRKYGFQNMIVFSFFEYFCICQYIDEVNEENWQNVLININF